MPVLGENALATKPSELAKRWSFSKNNKGPEPFFPGSSTTVWWECEVGHSFRAPIREMVLRWRCPHCERSRIKRQCKPKTPLFQKTEQGC